MNIQLDMFDMTTEEKNRRIAQDKIEVLATGKHLRGLTGKQRWDAHVSKMKELFGEE